MRTGLLLIALTLTAAPAEAVGFHFLYRVTDTTTGALIERGEKSYPDLPECENRQQALMAWWRLPRLDPRTKKLLPADSVEVTRCDPGRLDKMPLLSPVTP